MHLSDIGLCVFAALAGFVNSLVGGGGLIQVPAMMIFLPGVPLPTIFGTNKLAAMLGTTVSLRQYVKHVGLDKRATIPATLVAFVAAFFGAKSATLMAPGLLKPISLAMLIVVAIHTALQKDFGDTHAPRHTGHRQDLLGVVMGMVLGFYDGFFGPGTGTFLMFMFITAYGFDFLQASSSSKLVNVATNLAAFLLYASTGHVLYKLAIPLAIFNMLGSFAGSRLAILKGNRFVRVIFLSVVAVLIVKLAWDMWK